MYYDIRESTEFPTYPFKLIYKLYGPVGIKNEEMQSQNERHSNKSDELRSWRKMNGWDLGARANDKYEFSHHF